MLNSDLLTCQIIRESLFIDGETGSYSTANLGDIGGYLAYRLWPKSFCFGIRGDQDFLDDSG